MSNICNILNISWKAPLGITGNGPIKTKYYYYYLTIRRGLLQLIKIAYLSDSPNLAESLSPPLELRQLALYFLSSKTHRSTYAINTSQSFFERVWSTQLCSNKKSQSCVLCFRCSGFNVFLISRLNGTFTVLKWCLQ